jgi:hypothetical protein
MRWSDAQLSILLDSIDSPRGLQYSNLHRTILTERLLPLLMHQLAHLRELEFEYIPDITPDDEAGIRTNLADCAFLCEMSHLECATQFLIGLSRHAEFWINRESIRLSIRLSVGSDRLVRDRIDADPIAWPPLSESKQKSVLCIHSSLLCI